MNTSLPFDGMTIDQELIAQVQQLADEACTHRIRSLIACYVGFIGLLESNPELVHRAAKLERDLKAFRDTGTLPPRPGEVGSASRANTVRC